MDNNYDVIIVLGYDVTPSGRLPVEAKNRVVKAKQFYDKGKAGKIIMCGKFSFMHLYKPKKTEAEAMADYALKLGIPADDLILENRSRTTTGNAINSKEIAAMNNWTKLIVITSEFHIKRAETIFIKIYTDKYLIKFMESSSSLTDAKLKRLKLIEKLKLILY